MLKAKNSLFTVKSNASIADQLMFTTLVMNDDRACSKTWTGPLEKLRKGGMVEKTECGVRSTECGVRGAESVSVKVFFNSIQFNLLKYINSHHVR